MASYRFGNQLMAIDIIETIFMLINMQCKAEIWWIPMYDRWEAYLKIKYLYFNLNETIQFEWDRETSMPEFLETMFKIRKDIKKEFTYYFEAVWC